VKPPARSAFVPEGRGRRGTPDRAEWMIDGFRVGYDFGGGYCCDCVEFAARDSCKHTREAAGRLAAQSRIAEHLRLGTSKAYSIRGLVASGSRRRMQ
jgi:hypothetical protein